MSSLPSEFGKIADNTFRPIIRAAGSNKFFYATIVLVVAQAAWYACSFGPAINDEPRHVATIVVYSQQLSPFLTHQPRSWDHLGALTRDGSYLFYYLMSWPLRLARLFTSSSLAQLMVLRATCTVLFVGALIIYRRALMSVRAIPASVVNFVFVFLVLLPTVAILPATVNYDNMAMLLFAVVLLLAIRIIATPKLSVVRLGELAALALLISLVKWTSLALVVPVMLFVAAHLFRRYRTRPNLLKALRRAVIQAPRWQLVGVGLVCLLALGLFIERPVMNVVRYGSPNPPCQVILGPARCQAFPDYVAYTTLGSRAQNSGRLDPLRFLLRYWIPDMLHRTGNVYEATWTEIPSFKVIIGILLIASVGLVLIAFRRLAGQPLYWFLLLVVLFYVACLFIEDYRGYLTYGVPVAIRARYLIPILPMAGYLIAWSCYVRFRQYPKQLLLVAIVVIGLMTQGGGISTYALTTPQHAYWRNLTVRQDNAVLRAVLQRVVIR